MSLSAQTEACRELLTRDSGGVQAAPVSREQRRVRRVKAMVREGQEAASAWEQRKKREELEPAYLAKSSAELLELRTATSEGASKEEAAARAARAGQLAFDTALLDRGAVQADVDEYEARQAARRAEVARAAGDGRSQ